MEDYCDESVPAPVKITRHERTERHPVMTPRRRNKGMRAGIGILMLMNKRLVAVLHSLPVTAGARTLDRVDLARRTLGCSTAIVANLYPATLRNVGALHGITANEKVWQTGRSDILNALNGEATDVLLGFGVQLPTGQNRALFKEQLYWLSTELATRELRVWGFGRRPSHPSRWQRLVHREQPGGSLDEFAHQLLQPLATADYLPARHGRAAPGVIGIT
ncbi:hypothetical protein [Microbacterium sp. S1037]|uniref:hypothetical protein n=1 Tax=Microbacterium sp. S1037 TaxID=3398227 RepID=UPI003AAB7F38